MRKRQGFTLVELMVAMALTMFIMLILSQAFILALETFSGLKSIGDMQTNLRTAATALRNDLIQDHLEGKRRLSDPDMVTARPREGFFSVFQGTASTSEGIDPDGVASYKAFDHVLHFTVKRKGNRPEAFFTTQVPTTPPFDGYLYLTPYQSSATPGTAADATFTATQPFFSSQWAEIAYYLLKTGTTDEPTNPAGVTGTPLYSLYRAQLVIAPETSKLNGKYATAPGMSCDGKATLTFFSPNDVAQSQRSLDPAALLKTNAPGVGSTLLLPNVVSFQVQVQVLTTTTADFSVPAASGPISLSNASWVTANQILKVAGAGFLQASTVAGNNVTLQNLGAGNAAAGTIVPSGSVVGSTSFCDVPPNAANATVFDSASAAYGILAVQITIRVWDTRSGQARQITVTQDL